MLMCH